MSRTVLVADDSPTIQKKAQGILKGEGYEVETVSNGVAAIKKLAKLQPLVVLADVSMPGKDGYEVCDFIKNSEALRHVPVLLIASELEPYDEGRGQRVHADGRVKKPFEPQDLISVVAKFAAQAEAAAPPAVPVKPATPPPPPPAFEVAPSDQEMDVGAKMPGLALAGVSEGIAFSEPAAEAGPVAPPVPAFEAPPAAEAAAIPTEAAPTLMIPMEAADVATVPMEAAPPPPVAEEVPSETIPPEAAPEVVSAAAVPMEAAPEPGLAAAIPMEAAPPPTEPVAGEVSIQAEPVLLEEAPAPPPEEPPPPAAEATVMFRTPAQIAEPVLSEEGVSAPSAEAVPEPAEAEPVTATSLDSYSLSEAATGQVRIAPLGTEAPAEAAPEAAPPAPAPFPIDPQLVFSIVHKVVLRMSPPALTAETVEDMARQLADEIIADLQAEPPTGE